MVGIGAVIAVALFFIGAAGTLAYVLYGLAGILIALGVLNWNTK